MAALSSVHFLCGCHSTPFHSALHGRILSLHFLECSPRVVNDDESRSNATAFGVHSVYDEDNVHLCQDSSSCQQSVRSGDTIEHSTDALIQHETEGRTYPNSLSEASLSQKAMEPTIARASQQAVHSRSVSRLTLRG